MKLKLEKNYCDLHDCIYVIAVCLLKHFTFELTPCSIYVLSTGLSMSVYSMCMFTEAAI